MYFLKAQRNPRGPVCGPVHEKEKELGARAKCRRLPAWASVPRFCLFFSEADSASVTPLPRELSG